MQRWLRRQPAADVRFVWRLASPDRCRLRSYVAGEANTSVL